MIVTSRHCVEDDTIRIAEHQSCAKHVCNLEYRCLPSIPFGNLLRWLFSRQQ